MDVVVVDRETLVMNWVGLNVSILPELASTVRITSKPNEVHRDSGRNLIEAFRHESEVSE